MAYNALNNLIDAYIYANGVQAITGQILNGVLKQMVSQLGSGYHLMGVAGPETTPEQNDFAMAYFAATAGEYTDFGGITLAAGEVAVLLTSGNGSWSKQTIYTVPTTTEDLENTAGFITNAVTDLVNYYTKTEVDDTLANYPTLQALAETLADYYTKQEVDTTLDDYATKDGVDETLEDYYTKTEMDAALGDRYTKSETDTKLADYYKKTETYDKDEVDSIVAALSRQEYIVAWDGLSAPDVSAIPAGVTVTYSGTTYTGTLAASASTVNKIYMVWNGVAYDMYGTSQDGGYSWVPMGTTSVDLSQYATKAELSQLQQEVTADISQLEAEIYVGNGFPCDLEATRNLRPSSNNTVVTGNNGYSYIAKVKSGKSYHIELTVPNTSGNYLRGGFTQIYPANGVAVSGYWDNGTGEAILNKVAPFDGYLLLECAEDFTNIAIYEDKAGTIGREVYNNEVAQDVLKDTAVLAKYPVNLFDKSKDVVLNKYIIARRYEAAAGYAISGPIYVKGGVQYKCPHDSVWLSSSNVYAICTSSGEFYEGKQGTISGDFLLFTPEKDCYVCLNIGRSAWVDSFMLCAASDYPEQYVPYSKTIGDDYHLGAMQIQEVEDIVAPALEITQYFETEKSVNLFDKTSGLIKNGYYVGGAFHEDATYRVTHPIKVSGGIPYKAVFRANDLGASNTGIAVVDGANNVLSFVNGVVSGNYITITPTEDCYLSFNIGTNARLDEMMVCVETDFPESYEPYYEYTKLTGVEVEGASSPLAGKSVIFTGDSICYGATDTPQGAGWAKRIGEKNNMVWQNKGVSGGTIMNKDLIGSSFTISDTDFGTGADYIILEGGTNDADRIGSITGGNTPQYYGSWNESDYVTEFGKDTFCDAVQRLLQRVVTNFPSAKVGFIIAPKMGVTNNGYTKDTNNRRAYFQTIIEICRKWGVPVLNLWDECTMNPRLASHYTEGQNYLYADGQHPTANGYELMTPIIEKWMESL